MAPIVFHVYEQDPNDTMGVEKGWIVPRIEATLNGICIGYLKIQYGAESHKNWPEVAYSWVKPEYQRQGLGTQLYVRAAIWLAENKNWPLCGSTIQSDYARLLWGSLQSKNFPVDSRPTPWNKERFVPILDFTAVSNQEARELLQSLQERDLVPS